MNQFKAAMQPVSFSMPFIVLGASMALMALIFRVCFNYSMTNNEPEQLSLWHTKDALCQVKLPSKPSQAVKRLPDISDELVVRSGLDDHVIHVSFNVAV
jgi:hypothetical protein